MKYHLLCIFVLVFPPALIAGDIVPPKEIGARAKARVEHLSPDQLNRERAANADLLLVDVRTEQEYRAGHVAGALWIPRGKLEFAIQEHTTDPDKPIVVYCRSGARAALSALALKAVGYRNVRSVTDGFKGWVEAGQPVFNAHGKVEVIAFGAEEDPS